MSSSINEFEVNRYKINKNLDFCSLIDLLMQVRDFLSELGYLAFGRDMFVFGQTEVVNGNIILDSVTKTMENICFCCRNANFADAYSLLCKYRDDLFYYVYLFAVVDSSDFVQYVDVQQLSEDEKNIWNWVHNRQKDSHIGSVLKCVASHPSARKAVKDFQLKDSFDKLADKLNNHKNVLDDRCDSYLREKTGTQI